MAEQVDIYDANLSPVGSMDRLQAHKEGQWHKSFHCWVVSGQDGGRILFQVRSDDMENFPGCLDVSAAGHLEAGETVAEGVREVEEELGIQFESGNLHSLGFRVEVADQDNGQHNREYQAVYLLRFDEPLSSFRPQVEEVAGLLWVTIDDAQSLFTGERKTALGRGISYSKDSSKWVEVSRELTREDFLPRIQQYYLTAAIMGERLLQGKTVLSIS